MQNEAAGVSSTSSFLTISIENFSKKREAAGESKDCFLELECCMCR
ncbi:hypothetical protein MNBD_ALPHA03-586 [hydrothermal vent metagenome]|uniref:Uncharacterized protein n=1 Tax=hydrothermal vent metagenome TaxID=652676 RepID=A0A3B1ASJ5_9ZZZZ